MRQLALSPSTFYRNRAASTYRIAQRLLDLGHLNEAPSPVDPRDRCLRISDQGQAALRVWLSPPMPAVEVAHTIDLVRSRLNFLGVVTPAEQLALVDSVLVQLQGLQERNEAELAGLDDLAARITSLGTLHETRARISWLQEIRPMLAEAFANAGT